MKSLRELTQLTDNEVAVSDDLDATVSLILASLRDGLPSVFDFRMFEPSFNFFEDEDFMRTTRFGVSIDCLVGFLDDFIHLMTFIKRQEV